jgi:hypothetical protein
MQNRIWKLHPIEKLPLTISCWNPPTYPGNITRFGPIAFSAKPTKNNYQSKNNLAMDIDMQNFREDPMVNYNRQIEIERQETCAQQFEQLMIPAQPRKQIQQNNRVQVYIF